MLAGRSSDGFDAFISYAREPSTPLASQLQTSMERLPSRGMLRAMRVFRDDQSMARNTSLWSTIERGLRESSHLILLVTPQAAASQYVDKEIQWWVEHKGSANILLVHQRGPLAWDRSTNDFLHPRQRGAAGLARGLSRGTSLDESTPPTPSWPTVTNSPTPWRTCRRRSGD